MSRRPNLICFFTPASLAFFSADRTLTIDRDDVNICDFTLPSLLSAAAAERRLGRVKSQIFTSSRSMVKVRSAEKNAKLAGVKKQIRFGRLDISWLDAKLDENSVDLVVSYPPQFRNGVDSFSVAENRK